MKTPESCVLPSLAYGLQTWWLTDTQAKRIATTQRRMLRSMIGSKQKDKIKKSQIKRRTGAKNIGLVINELKFNYAGHMSRGRDKWNKLIEEWTPLDQKRNRERPPTRWRNSLVRDFGLLWKRMAKDRVIWKHTMEAYAQRWADRMNRAWPTQHLENLVTFSVWILVVHNS